jgi:hypothetical protein
MHGPACARPMRFVDWLVSVPITYLPRGWTLARLLAERRGVRNRGNLPRLSAAQVLPGPMPITHGPAPGRTTAPAGLTRRRARPGPTRMRPCAAATAALRPARPWSACWLPSAPSATSNTNPASRARRSSPGPCPTTSAPAGGRARSPARSWKRPPRTGVKWTQPCATACEACPVARLWRSS